MAGRRFRSVPARGAASRIPRQNPAGETGFLLPLSFGVSLVLLLSALSVQTVALHGSTLAASELQKRQNDDALASAAERVAGRLSGAEADLLRVPYPPAEGTPGLPGWSGLAHGQVNDRSYTVVTWQPGQPQQPNGSGGVPGLLRLRLSGAAPGAEGPERQFALSLAGSAPDAALRVVNVRGMGR
jgi:hypothetical protein